MKTVYNNTIWYQVSLSAVVFLWFCDKGTRCCSLKSRRVRNVDWTSKWRQSWYYVCVTDQFLWLHNGVAGSCCKDVSMHQRGNVLH